MLKLGTCQIGLKRLKEGKQFSAFKIERESELNSRDVVILVHEDDAVTRRVSGLYTVLNKKEIKIIQ